MVFKSAGGRGPIYRVQLKKAIQQNLDNLRLLETGDLPTQDAVVNLVLGVLDDSKSGLIPQKELKEAVIKVA
tara:strand:- start:35 stop:250 length:216 start_codon:yes stop_codon:yes gene_type:complete